METIAQRRKNILEALECSLKDNVLLQLAGTLGLPEEAFDQEGFLHEGKHLDAKIFHVKHPDHSYMQSFYVHLIHPHPRVDPASREGDIYIPSLITVSGDMGSFMVSGMSVAFMIDNIENTNYFFEKVPLLLRDNTVFVPGEVSEMIQEQLDIYLNELVEQIEAHLKETEDPEQESDGYHVSQKIKRPIRRVAKDLIRGLDRYNLREHIDENTFQEAERYANLQTTWSELCDTTDWDKALEIAYHEEIRSQGGFEDYDPYDFETNVLRGYALLRIFARLFKKKREETQEAQRQDDLTRDYKNKNKKIDSPLGFNTAKYAGT